MTTQSWDADSYKNKTGFVVTYGEDLLNLVPKDCQAIIDLGCGDGRLSRELASHCSRPVLGIDGAFALLRTIDDTAICPIQADGYCLPIADQSCDLVFSNAALHWMLQPDLVIAEVRRVLQPGGWFIGEFGGAGNVAKVFAAIQTVASEFALDANALNPWYFPTAAQYQKCLHNGGLHTQQCFTFARPTPLPGSLEDWLSVFAQAFFGQLGEVDQHKFITKTSDLLDDVLRDDADRWYVDYVRLRFVAQKL